MNDNTKKMIEQAGFIIDNDGKVWAEPGHHITGQIETLVKSIVEKCGDIANDYVDHGIPSAPIDRYFGI